jgi:hypothetical protein
MEIFLFALGVLLVILGLPLCFSCELQELWRKRSQGKGSQTEKTVYQNGILNRGIGLIIMVIGVILIILSFAGIAI